MKSREDLKFGVRVINDGVRRDTEWYKMVRFFVRVRLEFDRLVGRVF